MSVTKEQAMTEKSFTETTSSPTGKPRTWRANGKCKTWKRDTTRFELPIKHGLYSYGYLTNDNCHLFNVKE